MKDLIAKLLMDVGLSIRVVSRIDNHKIIFITRSYLEYRLRAKRSYHREKVTMYWLRSIVQPEDVVYDIGANVGAYALYAGIKSKSGGGQVYAFEPAFPNFFSLGRNIEVNNLNQQVIPYALAFSNHTGGGKMYLSDTLPGSALHGLGCPKSEGQPFNPAFVQGVFTTTVDEFSSQTGTKFPNHIKIDVDGSELDIVSGMSIVLKDQRLKSIMIEIDQDVSRGRIETALNNSGFLETRSEQWDGKNTFNKLFVRI